MFDKLSDFYNVFRAGQSVADAVGLKNKQMIGNAITVLLGALVAVGKLYGIDLHLDDASLVTIGGFVTVLLGLFNVGTTVASTDKIGLLPPKQLPEDFTSPDFGISLPVPKVSLSDNASEQDSESSTAYPSLRGLDTTYYG